MSDLRFSPVSCCGRRYAGMEVPLPTRLWWIPVCMENPLTRCFSWIPANQGNDVEGGLERANTVDFPSATAGTGPLAKAGLRGNDGSGRSARANAPEVPCATVWADPLALAGSHRVRFSTPLPQRSGREMPSRHLGRSGRLRPQSMPGSGSDEPESDDGTMSSSAARPLAETLNTATPLSRSSRSSRRASSFGAKNASIP